MGMAPEAFTRLAEATAPDVPRWSQPEQPPHETQLPGAAVLLSYLVLMYSE
jgi:hypothetical protein